VLSVHFLQHGVRPRLESEVQMWSHMRQVEVRREDIERHIMRIGAREADTIESVDFTDFF
jgi:hypothetical protein